MDQSGNDTKGGVHHQPPTGGKEQSNGRECTPWARRQTAKHAKNKHGQTAKQEVETIVSDQGDEVPHQHEQHQQQVITQEVRKLQLSSPEEVDGDTGNPPSGGVDG